MTAQRHRERPTTPSTHVRYIVNRRADLPTAAKMSTVLVLSSPVASFGGLRLRLAIRGRLLHKTDAQNPRWGCSLEVRESKGEETGIKAGFVAFARGPL